MATVTGYVERIKYRNEDNGYSVLSVADGGEEYILVGTFPYISEGERIEATGRMVEHSIYGEQLAVESYEIKAPEDTLAIERYLGSGAIKGIGAALAKRIVKKFKADTFRIMEEEPERLAEVKGVSERMAMEISSQVEEKRDMRQAMVFLQQYGISMNLAVKIYQHYGPGMYSVIQENPYQLADDIQGVGFKIADEIAAKVGIFTDSDYRIRSGLFYALLDGKRPYISAGGGAVCQCVGTLERRTGAYGKASGGSPDGEEAGGEGKGWETDRLSGAVLLYGTQYGENAA